MHRIHTSTKKHSNNNGEVWWDILFGTYHNPEKFTTSCGFDPPKEERLLDMLALKNVHKWRAVARTLRVCEWVVKKMFEYHLARTHKVHATV